MTFFHEGIKLGVGLLYDGPSNSFRDENKTRRGGREEHARLVFLNDATRRFFPSGSLLTWRYVFACLHCRYKYFQMVMKNVHKFFKLFSSVLSYFIVTNTQIQNFSTLFLLQSRCKFVLWFFPINKYRWFISDFYLKYFSSRTFGAEN